MGAKLVKAFEAVKAEGGFKFQMRLAMKSGMSSDKAQTEPDSPDNIAKMQKAYKDVTGKDIQL